MERTITVTTAQLAKALEQWEKDDKAGKTEPSTDPLRHNWTADYLMDLIEKA